MENMNLSGWKFIVLRNGIEAQGTVIGHMGDNTVLKFDGKVNFAKVLTPLQMQDMTLFPSDKALAEFLAVITAPPAPEEQQDPDQGPDDNPEGVDVDEDVLIAPSRAEFDNDAA